MAKRITQKNVGQMFELKFHASHPDLDRYDFFTLNRIEGEGKKERAFFKSDSEGEWMVYRDEYNGRWCYGSSAQRLTVMPDRKY